LTKDSRNAVLFFKNKIDRCRFLHIIVEKDQKNDLEECMMLIKKEMFNLNGFGGKFSLLKKEKEKEKVSLTLEEQKAALVQEEENIDILSTEIEDKVHTLEDLSKDTNQKKNEFLEAEKILKEKKAAFKEAEKIQKQAEKEIKQLNAEKDERIVKHAASCKEYEQRDEQREKLKESIRGGIPIDEARLTKEIVDKIHLIHAFEKELEEKNIQPSIDKLAFKLVLNHKNFSSTYLIETPFNYIDELEVYRFASNKIELIGSGKETSINWKESEVSKEEIDELNKMIIRELYILQEHHAEQLQTTDTK
jgi:hypothetical protein